MLSLFTGVFVQFSRFGSKRRYWRWILLSFVLMGLLLYTPVGIRLSRIVTVELRGAQWFVMQPANYRYRLIGMRGLFSDPGCAIVTVTDYHISHIDGCEHKRFDPSVVAVTEDTVSMAYVFEVVERALAENAETLEIVYEPWLGYPIAITLDGERRVDFDEASYRVEDFTIDP